MFYFFLMQINFYYLTQSTQIPFQIVSIFPFTLYQVNFKFLILEEWEFVWEPVQRILKILLKSLLKKSKKLPNNWQNKISLLTKTILHRMSKKMSKIIKKTFFRVKCRRMWRNPKNLKVKSPYIPIKIKVENQQINKKQRTNLLLFKLQRKSRRIVR